MDEQIVWHSCIYSSPAVVLNVKTAFDNYIEYVVLLFFEYDEFLSRMILILCILCTFWFYADFNFKL